MATDRCSSVSRRTHRDILRLEWLNDDVAACKAGTTEQVGTGTSVQERHDGTELAAAAVVQPAAVDGRCACQWQNGERGEQTEASDEHEEDVRW